MSLKIIVLAKQVPDTRNVGPDAMTAEGTVNRTALPAIFNPEDLNALEVALQLKENHPGTTIDVLTMGPARAAEILREAIFRGADNGWLLTDRAFAGADTLATSYALATAIRHIAPDADLILCGRQAIDGDTAQVGPQVAEKLGLNQITYVESIEEYKDDTIIAKRQIDGGVEIVAAPLPCVLTVTGSATPCRPRNVKRVMQYKRALCPAEIPAEGVHYPFIQLGQLSCADIDADLSQCGLAGSPTKVKHIENIVFKAKENLALPGSDADINMLMKTLIDNHTIG